MTIETGTGLAGPDPIPITTDIGATVTVTHEEVTLDPFTDPHTTAHHATEAQAHIITNKTPHTVDPHHAEVSPETTVGLDLIHHTNITTKHQQDHLPALIKQPGKPKTGNISRSPLMIHPPNTTGGSHLSCTAVKPDSHLAQIFVAKLFCIIKLIIIIG